MLQKNVKLKGAGAIALGLVLTAVLSNGTDRILETAGALKIPFTKNPLWLMIVVFLYRLIAEFSGGYITARTAPLRPARHALILGAIGFILSVMGGIALWDHAPAWYNILLAVTAIPITYLGGWIYTLQFQNKTNKRISTIS